MKRLIVVLLCVLFLCSCQRIGEDITGELREDNKDILLGENNNQSIEDKSESESSIGENENKEVIENDLSESDNERSLQELLESEVVKRFIQEFSASSNVYIGLGKNDPSAFDLSKEYHFITHLMAFILESYPPYSLNEVNAAIQQFFPGNEGIGFDDVDFWSSYAIGIGEVDSTNPDIYTDADLKFLGCSFAHGGTAVSHKITEAKADGKDSAVYTVEYYDDFENLDNVVMVIDYYFDMQNDVPALVGVDVVSDTGEEIAVESF